MKNSSSRYFWLALIYAVTLVVYLRYMPKGEAPKPPPQTITQLQQHEQLLVQQARTGGATLSLPEREQDYQKALRDLDQIARLDPNSDLAIDAQFQKGALLQEMADPKRAPGANSKHLDEATNVYRTLKKQYPHQFATITVAGKPERVRVSQAAEDQLKIVLPERDRLAHNSVLYQVIDKLVDVTGRIPGFSYWFALLMLTLIIKGVLYPFSKLQYKSMQDMQRVAPLIKEAQEKLKGRPAQEIQARTMQIYRENNVNMAAGCMPAIVQMAALFPLYWMIRAYEYQFQYGHFLWIGSALSHQYPRIFATSLATFDLPLFVLYLVSMFLTSKMSPPPADPQQAQQQRMMMYMMPLMFGWFMYSAQWPSAFTFYWLVLNTVSTVQQYYILKQHPRVVPATSGAGSGSTGSGGRDGGGGREPRDRPVSPGPGAPPALTNGRNGRGSKSSAPSEVGTRSKARRKLRR